ncbi:MAG: hypothetical protein KAR11_03370 [Phycisphaerae bacterium]|nr:hypothetical protein [Phycisphaerae bacterium]
MAVQRPTFHESWYRISAMHPRLRAGIEVRRQFYRGQKWYTLCDPGNNDHFRLTESAYYVVALLDGTRTIQQAWEQTMTALGDAAPTQGETIQLLGQLYSSNLLRGDVPPDVEGMFTRFRKRQMREIGGTLGNLMFLKIPLFDPDRILNGLVKVFWWVYSPVGYALWAIIIALGARSLLGRWDSLTAQANNILDPSNLLWLYVCFAGIKAIHEIGHGLACKKFGQSEGTLGEVHTIGIMLLVLTPMPYVDATSSWSFRRKWRRVAVAASGMYLELAVAAIAAILWANSASGSLLHAISYNVMFIASVSTILFNANPLLRFDGYYILADILEIPNLNQRSKQYLYYLVRKYAWRVKNPRSPAHNPGERRWFFFYAIAATIYRIFICISILTFVAEKLFFVGVMLAVVSVVMWVILPLWKFVKYLAISHELTRNRPWAIASTLVFFGVISAFVGLYQWPDRFVAEGIVESVNREIYHAGTDGFLMEISPTNEKVDKGYQLYVLSNPDRQSEAGQLQDQLDELEARRKLAQRDKKFVEAKMYASQIDALGKKLQRIKSELARQVGRADFTGLWVAPRMNFQIGRWIKRGDPLGMLTDPQRRRFRVVVGQDEAARLYTDRNIKVEFYLQNRTDLPGGTGRIEKIIPAGQSDLPSASLGFSSGGNLAIDPSEKSGRKTLEKFFEVWIEPNTPLPSELYHSQQKIVVRFELSSKPLGQQWFRGIHQMFRKRFSK